MENQNIVQSFFISYLSISCSPLISSFIFLLDSFTCFSSLSISKFDNSCIFSSSLLFIFFMASFSCLAFDSYSSFCLSSCSLWVILGLPSSLVVIYLVVYLIESLAIDNYFFKTTIY